MPRLCSICRHPQRHAIDAALVRHGQSYRGIASEFGVDDSSLQRHAETHLRSTLQQSKELAMLASSASLIGELNRLHQYVSRVLDRGEAAGDDRLVLLGVGQGQRNVETLAKLGPLGDLEKRLAALEGSTGTGPGASHGNAR